MGWSLRYLVFAWWLCVGGGKVGEGTVLLPGFLRLAQHTPCFQSLHPLSYATGCVTLLAVATVVIPRVGRFMYVLFSVGPLNRLS